MVDRVLNNPRFLRLFPTHHTTEQKRGQLVLFSRLVKQGIIFPSMTLENETTTGRKIGYARVSTDSQELSLQLDALKNHGIADELIFTDKASGAKTDRSGLERCLTELKSGDVLVVWRLDRLGRSTRHLVTLIEELQERNVGFRSLSDGAIDTTTPSGELIFGIFAALAQFERRLIQERTKAGLLAARARGKMGGRPKMSIDDPRVRMAKALHRDPTMSIADICRSLKVSKATLYRYLKVGKESNEVSLLR